MQDFVRLHIQKYRCTGYLKYTVQNQRCKDKSSTGSWEFLSSLLNNHHQIIPSSFLTSFLTLLKVTATGVQMKHAVTLDKIILSGTKYLTQFSSLLDV